MHGIVLTKICATCGTSFKTEWPRKTYCSDACKRGVATCERCGKDFVRAKGTAGRFCSTECWYATPRKIIRTCERCGSSFTSSKARQRYCGLVCAGEARRTKPDRVCLTCRTPIERSKHSKIKFCSRSCAMAGRLRQGQKPAHRYVDANGYVRVKVDGKWQLEHRVVVERRLGRPLTRRETVHHLNGQRADNRDENLELRVGGHGPGASAPHCPSCTCFAH